MTSSLKKRLLQNSLLLIVVAALIVFVTTDKRDEVQQYKTLYDASIGDEVTQITIHSGGREDVVLQMVDDVWMVVKPTKFVADTAKIQHLFTLLSENAESSYAIKGKDLASYGLDENKLSVSFNGVKIQFGKFNTVTRKRFIRKAEKMYVVEETVSGLMQMGADGFKPSTRPLLKAVTE